MTYTDIKNRIIAKEVNKHLTKDKLHYLNEIIDKKIIYMNGISVERTRQAVRTELKLRFFKKEISEKTYLILCNINESIAYNYRYL